MDCAAEDDSLRKNKEGGLTLKTRGWKWAQKTPKKAKKNVVLKIDIFNRFGKYTVSEAAGLGKVDTIWVVARDSPRGELAELPKVKLDERANPDPTLGRDRKKEIKESCWILEERDGDFFCDCKFGFKGHLSL